MFARVVGSQAAKLTADNNAREIREAEQVEAFFQKFDTDQNDTLSREEVKNLIKYLNYDQDPDQDAVDLIFETARQIPGAAVRSANQTESVTRAGLTPALHKWRAYLKEKKFIDETFAKYDTSGDGKLETSELEKLMQDLNGGKKVKPADVEFVMKICDESNNAAIDRRELLPAIAVWHEIVQEQSTLLYKMESTVCTVS